MHVSRMRIWNDDGSYQVVNGLSFTLLFNHDLGILRNSNIKFNENTLSASRWNSFLFYIYTLFTTHYWNFRNLIVQRVDTAVHVNIPKYYYFVIDFRMKCIEVSEIEKGDKKSGTIKCLTYICFIISMRYQYATLNAFFSTLI